jgi:hypothetical protein
VAIQLPAPPFLQGAREEPSRRHRQLQRGTRLNFPSFFLSASPYRTGKRQRVSLSPSKGEVPSRSLHVTSCSLTCHTDNFVDYQEHSTRCPILTSLEEKGRGTSRDELIAGIGRGQIMPQLLQEAQAFSEGTSQGQVRFCQGEQRPPLKAQMLKRIYLSTRPSPPKAISGPHASKTWAHVHVLLICAYETFFCRIISWGTVAGRTYGAPEATLGILRLGVAILGESASFLPRAPQMALLGT